MTLLAVVLGTGIALSIFTQLWTLRQIVHAVQIWNVGSLKIDATVEPSISS